MNGKIPVNRIYREETRAVSDDQEDLQRIPTFAHMKSAFYKSRRQAFGPVPTSLELLGVPEQLQRLENGKRFLLYQEQGNKILNLGTEKDFHTVCTSAKLFVDGTFDDNQSFFAQLFTVHTFTGGKQFPRLYCFLENKTADIYTRLINALKDLATSRGVSFAPRRITSDFESGWIAAVSDSLPTTSISGRFFHFTQAIRKMSTMGLMKKYRDDDPFRNVVRKVMGLAFLPLDRVLPTIGEITYA